MIKAEQLVKQVLEKNPITRSNDKELQIACMEAQGFVFYSGQKDKFRRLFSTESIRRSRQFLQAQGFYPPDEKTKRGRKLKQDRMRIEMKKKEYVPQYDGLGRLQGYLIK